MALFGRKKPVEEAAPEVVADEPLQQRTPAEQRAALLEGVRPLAPVGLSLDDALGLTLCESIDSDLDLPMVTTSRVEGYGLRAANIVGASENHPIELRVVGVVERTDELPTHAVAPGACVLLAAGAPAPKGVDAVVPLGDAELTGRVVTFTFEAKLHQNMTLRGSHLADGTRLIDSGTTLDARALALLAEVGLDKVLVRPKPRVATFSVGQGLVAPGEPVTAIDKHYSSASTLLASCAKDDGAAVERLPVLGRNAAAITARLQELSQRADVILVLADQEADVHLVADLLGASGPTDRAHVALNAGGPQALGRVGSARVVVLPAQPVSAQASYLLLVRPLLDALAGRTVEDAPTRVRIADGVQGGSGERYVPVRLGGDVAQVQDLPDELSYDLYRADALLVVPSGGLSAGVEADALPLHGPRGA